VYGSVTYVLDHWKKFNQTTPNPIVNSESDRGMTIEHHIYNQGDRGVSVEHYKYEGGEHVWFSATYQGQNTATLIWNFLSRYDIDGLR
jgi:polyhydroxybutyrate depolymerase